VTAPDRITLMGCPVDRITLDQALERIANAMADRGALRHTALNTAKLVKMRNDSDLGRDVVTSDMVTADGMGIVLAARLLGRRLPGRVTGIALMEETLALCARRGLRPYLLGARPAVLAAAIARLRARHPALRLAGAHDGYFRPQDEPEIVAAIIRSGADCLFVALPTPMKERFLARNRDRFLAPFVMGVGGAFDVLAGQVTRAPGWMQRAGLEWLFRTLQEPRRMWRRYLSTNTIFAGWLIAALICRVAGVAYAPATARRRAA